MSQSLLPRLTSTPVRNTNPPQAARETQKASTACDACRRGKIKCSGQAPCVACVTRGVLCVLDVTTDRRRKVAHRRTLNDLAHAQVDLERHRLLLNGIVAILHAGRPEDVDDLLTVVRSDTMLAQLPDHIRGTCRANYAVEETFASIDLSAECFPPAWAPSIVSEGNLASESIVQHQNGESTMSRDL